MATPTYETPNPSRAELEGTTILNELHSVLDKVRTYVLTATPDKNAQNIQRNMVALLKSRGHVYEEYYLFNMKELLN